MKRAIAFLKATLLGGVVVVLPAWLAVLTWWDLDANQLRKIDFLAHTFDVSPSPAMETALTAPASALKWVIPALITVLLLAVILWRNKFRRVCRRWLAPWRPIHLQPLNPTS